MALPLPDLLLSALGHDRVRECQSSISGVGVMRMSFPSALVHGGRHGTEDPEIWGAWMTSQGWGRVTAGSGWTFGFPSCGSALD